VVGAEDAGGIQTVIVRTNGPPVPCMTRNVMGGRCPRPRSGPSARSYSARGKKLEERLRRSTRRSLASAPEVAKFPLELASRATLFVDRHTMQTKRVALHVKREALFSKRAVRLT
jgi:hypothetical protein